MSNSLAIAAVTATVRNLLFAGLNADVAGTSVTTRPLDRARTNGVGGNQVNLFLYQTALDAAWRNHDLPSHTLAGEDGRPPLPLTLHYLVTAYGDADDEVVSHRLLGRAMSLLHDHPLLGAAEIKAALAASDLDRQVERVRITPQPMSLEEMSKLWTTFQTQYRVSAAYEASVVLIESTLPTRAPVPVLTRGENDYGVLVVPTTEPFFPTIESVEFPHLQPSARLGDVVLLRGHDLEATTSIRIVHPRLAAPLELAPDAVASDLVQATLPNQPDRLPAGVAAIAAVSAGAGAERWVSNGLALALAPTVSRATANPQHDGSVRIRVDCRPQLVPGQDIWLILGDRQLHLPPLGAATGRAVFVAHALASGSYLLRLRVDGVDSHLVDREAVPPRFDPTQRVNVP